MVLLFDLSNLIQVLLLILFGVFSMLSSYLKKKKEEEELKRKREENRANQGTPISENPEDIGTDIGSLGEEIVDDAPAGSTQRRSIDEVIAYYKKKQKKYASEEKSAMPIIDAEMETPSKAKPKQDRNYRHKEVTKHRHVIDARQAFIYSEIIGKPKSLQ